MKVIILNLGLLYFLSIYTLYANDYNKRIKVSFLPGSDALAGVIKNIKSARKRVDIGMFYITHQVIFDALAHKASRGVDITLYLDSAMASETYREKMQKLIRAGAEVYIENLPKGGKVHSKFAVIDSKKVITGTANWTKFGFEGANLEDIIFLEDEEIAQKYLLSLEKIANNSTKYEYKATDLQHSREKHKFPTKKEYTISDNIKARNKKRDMKKFKLESPLKVILTPCNTEIDDDNNPFFVIAQAIDKAKSEIELAMYANTSDRLLSAMSRAIARGVRIRMVVDEWMMSGRMRANLQKLHDEGAEIFHYHKNHGSMHLKSMVIDKKLIWRGSGNFTTHAGSIHLEDFMELKSERLAKHYLKFYEEIRNSSEGFIGNSKLANTEKTIDKFINPKTYTWQKSTFGKYDIGLPPPKTRKTKADYDIFDMKFTPAKSFNLKGEAYYLSNEDYYPILLEMIKTAQQSIAISMYSVGYKESVDKSRQPRIENLIKELGKAVERGVYVYCVFEVSQSPGSGYEQANSPLSARLREIGVDARLDVPTIGLHDKMVVVDLCKVIIGSHNWSEGALKGDRVAENSVFFLADKQYPELMEYITSRKIIYDMSDTESWMNEIAHIRKISSMKKKNRKQAIEDLVYEASE